MANVHTEGTNDNDDVEPHMLFRTQQCNTQSLVAGEFHMLFVSYQESLTWCVESQ